ncbi:putative Transcription initiation factor TFIID subunit A [Monocercomonoides exilis]|uniref:putative Transcription initiation factor TFIID subunit A n=1 Tax=Monocercomonoides exilis TaxID=2049356 RepID=UPI00355938FB|nr:putative Transcription initiation factor TFIID subunit A [Monocercomonoides exilis]
MNLEKDLRNRYNLVIQEMEEELDRFCSEFIDNFHDIYLFLEKDEVDKLHMAYATSIPSEDISPLNQAKKIISCISGITADQVDTVDRSIIKLKDQQSNRIKMGYKLLNQAMASFSKREIDKGRLIRPGSLQRIAKSIDPSIKLDKDVEELIMQESEAFVDAIIKQASLLSAFRGSETVEICDFQIILESKYDIKVAWQETDPSDENKHSKNRSIQFKSSECFPEPSTLSLHQKRIASIFASSKDDKVQTEKGEKTKLF